MATPHTPTHLRNESDRLARNPATWPAALDLARTIDDPWFRCQALTTAAETAPDASTTRTLLEEAFAAAYQQAEPNRAVTVASWPLRALGQLDDRQWLERELDHALTCIAAEPHPTRRADAQLALLTALPAAASDLIRRTADALLTTCGAGHGWRRNRILRDAALHLSANGFHPESDRCVDQVEDPRVQRQAQAWRRPRPAADGATGMQTI